MRTPPRPRRKTNLRVRGGVRDGTFDGIRLPPCRLKFKKVCVGGFRAGAGSVAVFVEAELRYCPAQSNAIEESRLDQRAGVETFA